MTAAARITGLRVTASWIHLKGLEVKGVPQILTTQHESWGIYKHWQQQHLRAHQHAPPHGPRALIAQGGNNLVLNCDSHHNYDPKSSTGPGTNADASGATSTPATPATSFAVAGPGTTTDDGFDLISASSR